MPASPNYIAAQEKALGWEPVGEICQVSGPEAAKFLNAYVTQDILKLVESQIAPAAFLTQKGKLISEAWVLRRPGRFLLLFPPGYGAKTGEHLATFLLFANVEWSPTEAWAHFAAIGPGSTALLEGALGGQLSADPGTVLSRGLEGQELLLFASDRFGLPGWEILVPASAAGAWRQKMEAWIGQGLMARADPGTLQTLRIEAGLPAMGVDMSEDNLVAEVGLDAGATSFNKGCYLGQETTARVQSRGHVNRKLARLRWQGQIPSLPAELFQGEKKVGTLSSAAESPKAGGSLGLGMVALSAWEKPEPIFFKDGNQEIAIERWT
ncbi:MAG TPA: hypothetical protein VJR29_04830 [bacterium]|nr:hypothetical protein [bacterium]